MANVVRFQMYSGPPVTISGDDPFISKEFTVSKVQSITVTGYPWVFFDSHCYGGDFIIYREGKEQPFPTTLNSGFIKSVRRINGGIDSSQVTLYAYPFFKGTEEPLESKRDQLPNKYLSLKVSEGAVIFFDDENCTGEKRILLKGDEVQNFTAVKLTSIGQSMITAREMRP